MRRWMCVAVGVTAVGVAACAASPSRPSAAAVRSTIPAPVRVSSQGASPVSSQGASPTVDPASAQASHDRCLSASATSELLDWVPTTVAELRAFRYGPAQLTPLRDSFPSARGDTPGSLCGVLGGADIKDWWAVVDRYPTVRALTVGGPGEGDFQGLQTRQPTVP